MGSPRRSRTTIYPWKCPGNRDRALARGVNVLDGKVTYEAVAEAHGFEYTPLEDVLPLSPV